MINQKQKPCSLIIIINIPAKPTVLYNCWVCGYNIYHSVACAGIYTGMEKFMKLTASDLSEKKDWNQTKQCLHVTKAKISLFF